MSLLREALDLWRGDPLADLGGAWAERVRESGRHLYADAVVAWAKAELRLGNAGPMIARVRDALAEHPLVEPLAAVLMRALVAEGRAAEALDQYAEIRRRLADDLGADPGPELQQVHQAVLRGELDRPVAPAVPAQLPPDVAGFAGRAEELARLDAMTSGIVTIAGSAGVGKTSLAVHWAHRVRDRFPDGQLFLNLRGFGPDGQATKPADAIRGFLDGLGVPPERVPPQLDAQTGLFRTLLANRRVLVVLDNARDAAQVRPLLPGSAASLVLVTSRGHLPALIATEGANPISLDLPTVAEARDLLAHRLGHHRVAREPDAADEIIARCARLPLALAVVAARAATHPAFPLAALAAELADDALVADADPATDVRTVFSWSYRRLTEPAARLFRLLGLHPGPDIAAATAASLAGLSLPGVRPLLAELTETHLLAEPSPARYSFHDLLRAYAAELAEAHDPVASRAAAQRRMLDHYLHTAVAATMLLHPHRQPITVAPSAPDVTPAPLADPAAALGWFTTEHACLIAAVDQAARSGLDRHVWSLAWAASLYLQNHGHFGDRIVTQRAALDAARRLADRDGQADAHRGIAQAYVRLGRHADAQAHLEQALDLFGDDVEGQAHIQLDLARMSEVQGRHGEALDRSRVALDRYRAAGSERGQARALNAIGWCHAHLGDFEQALADCREALALQENIGDRTGQADTWDSIGYAHSCLGQYGRATDCYRRALELWRALGSRNHEAETLTSLGDTADAIGDGRSARANWQQALTILDELGHPDADLVREKLS